MFLVRILILAEHSVSNYDNRWELQNIDCGSTYGRRIERLVAAQMGRHPAAPDCAVFFQRLKCELTAGWLVPTVKPYPRRKDQAIGFDGQCQDMGKWAHVSACNFFSA